MEDVLLAEIHEHDQRLAEHGIQVSNGTQPT
jgi:hypothetical protein